MPKEIQPEEDNWHGVTDPKKRKQIQDRLAQRARRKWSIYILTSKPPVHGHVDC
jgi:hypothetical protein